MPKRLNVVSLVVAISAALVLFPALSEAQSRRVVVAGQAERTLIAEANETLDVMFLDGTSVLAAPGSEVGVSMGDAIVLTPSDNAVLRVTAGQPGLRRLVVIRGPGTEMQLTGGAGLIEITEGTTRAVLLLDGEMTVATPAGSRRLYRAGFGVESADGRVSRARRWSGDEIATALGRIAPGLARGPSYGPRRLWLVPRRVAVAQQTATPFPPLVAGVEAGAETLQSDGTCDASTEGGTDPDCAILAALGAETLEQVLSGNARSEQRTVTTPPPPPPPPPPPGIPDFDSGWGDLDFGLVYQGSGNDLLVVAEATSSISDGAEVFGFQEIFGDITVLDDDTSSTSITSILADPTVAFIDPTLLEGAAPHSFGPTTGTAIRNATWDAVAPAGTPGPLLGSAAPEEGGFAYLLGQSFVTFPGERILALRSRTESRTSSSDISGEFLFRDLPSENGVFRSLRLRPDIADTQDLTPVESSFTSQFFDPDEYPPRLAFGLNFGHVLSPSTVSGKASGRAPDNFVVLEIVDAIEMDFSLSDDGSGFKVDDPAALSGFASTEPSALVSREDIARGDGPFVPVRRVTKPDRDAPSRLIFAAGDLDGLIQSLDPFDPTVLDNYTSAYSGVETSVDRFAMVGSVMDWFAEAPADTLIGASENMRAFSPDRDLRFGTRSFLRGETWTDLGRGTALDTADVVDRGVWIIHPASEIVNIDGVNAANPGDVVSDGAQSALLHADFGFQLIGGRQFSSISTTIGDVTYRVLLEPVQADVNGTPLPNVSTDALLSARTVASSNDGTGRASTLVFSDWESSAAGGGNPKVSFSGDTPEAGRLGFFVMQNAGRVFDDVADPAPAPLSGGVERPVGVDPGQPDQAFGSVRLGVGAEGYIEVNRAQRLGEGLTGYATALAEVEGGQTARVGIAPVARPANGPNLTIDAPDASLNTISGRLTIAGKAIAFGGVETVADRSTIRGAYGDDLTWGMQSTTQDTQMAIVSAEPVARALTGGDFTDTAGAPVPIPVEDKAYDYVQWGFFFGDAFTSDSSRQHVHLGSFAAGRPIADGLLDQADGTATYTGHAVGNVYSRGAVYTSVGTFSDAFNFSNRTGDTTLDFDRQRYTGGSTLSGSAYAGTVTGGDRSGTLAGRFVGGMSTDANGFTPNALVGGFELQNGSSDPATAYRATGTFGAEK